MKNNEIRNKIARIVFMDKEAIHPGNEYMKLGCLSREKVDDIIKVITEDNDLDLFLQHRSLCPKRICSFGSKCMCGLEELKSKL